MRRLLRLGSVGVFTCAAIPLVAIAAGAAAPPSLYQGPAQRLLPSAAELRMEMTSLAGAAARATASYTGTSPDRTATISVQVFKTEAAARTSLDSARCEGCELGSFKTRWKYKLGLQPAGDGTSTTVTMIGQCRNLRTDITATLPFGRIALTAWPRQVTDSVFVKAERLGMTRCGQTRTTPAPTGRWFWTESYAEAMVIKKVRIPGCNVYPENPNCDRIAGAPFRLGRAECRGLDEKPGTFTYSRFTCEIVLYNGQARGRIAVWPTGPTTLRWRIL